MDAGAAGEFLVACVRLILAGFAFLIPAVDRLLRPGEQEVTIGLSFATVALLLAILAWRVTRRNLYRPWIGFATGLLDVTLVSLAPVSFLLIDQPHTTLNSRVVYPIYLLAIAAAALRFDPRNCAVTGSRHPSRSRRVSESRHCPPTARTRARSAPAPSVALRRRSGRAAIAF